MHTFKLWCADTLIGIDEIPAGGVVLAGGRQTLIVFLLTVQAMVALMRNTNTHNIHDALLHCWCKQKMFQPLFIKECFLLKVHAFLGCNQQLELIIVMFKAT